MIRHSRDVDELFLWSGVRFLLGVDWLQVIEFALYSLVRYDYFLSGIEVVFGHVFLLNQPSSDGFSYFRPWTVLVVSKLRGRCQPLLLLSLNCFTDNSLLVNCERLGIGLCLLCT